MNRISVLIAALFAGTICQAQTFETKYARPLGDVLNDVAKRFDVRLKFNVDTAGLKLDYADFRVRPYSLEETFDNILKPFDFYALKQNGNLYKIKKYEYPRRQASDGWKLLPYLASKYSDRASWELRRDSLRREVRQRLGIDPLLARCSKEKPLVSKIRKYDGYTVQNFCMKTVGGHTVKGSIYTPATKGKHPLIICPNGHFINGRYGTVQQQRLATLARMGAICVDYDLWGWGESEDEVGEGASDSRGSSDAGSQRHTHPRLDDKPQGCRQDESGSERRFGRRHTGRTSHSTRRPLYGCQSSGEPFVVV